MICIDLVAIVQGGLVGLVIAMLVAAWSGKYQIGGSRCSKPGDLDNCIRMNRKYADSKRTWS